MSVFVVVLACLLLAAAAGAYAWLVRKGRKVVENTGETQGPPETSLRDPVTGLYNRKHLLRRLQDTLAKCDRKNENRALILGDIDGFIDFNNRFSQREGDRFLKKVADTVRRSLRVYDEAFRSGPDEFCAILAPGDERIAADVTERVSQAVEKNLFEDDPEYSDQKFSISSGIVFYPQDAVMPEALLHAAGQALYKSRVSRVSL